MKRFLFGTISALLTLGFAFFLEGGKVASLFLISPFLMTFGLPFFAVLAVWNLKTWGRAWSDALVPACEGAREGARESGTREVSARLWEFYEKICYAAGFLAFIVGCVIILSTAGQDAARIQLCFAVNLISPLYAVFFAILARILRYRVLAGN